MRPASHGLAHWSDLTGCDLTEGIVSVDADRTGRVRVWRRAGQAVEVTEQRFPNWFLATSLDLLAHVSAEHLPPARLSDAYQHFDTSRAVVVVDLDGHAAQGEDAYRYLVLAANMAEVETELVEMSNKRDGGEAETLADLRGLVLAWHPIEQYLTLSGRTYFKGMAFEDLRRLQFDLETTGLDEDRDRIFMVSVRDSSGWQACLDTGSRTEAEVIQQFVDLVRGRDPDVLENHNIFAFDLPFLVKRATRLGVRLQLGRDGSEPWLESDMFDAGERGEPLPRWRVAGREVIDTQHAVRRFGLGAPDMRRHGLKDAARYFGFARGDREYVAGVDVWPTYRTDPERIRRYAADDVEEVDGLSRRLLPETFALASMLPRSYERIAADYGAVSLWDLLLVRAYLHAGRAIGAPAQVWSQPSADARAELLYSGVFGRCVRVVVRSLLARVIVAGAIHASNDELQALPGLIEQLLDSATDAAHVLAAAGAAYLGDQGILSDPQAVARAWELARQFVRRVADELRARGCTVIEIDGDQVLVATPDGWSEVVEHEVARAAEAWLPAGVHLSYAGQYRAVYARGPRSAMVLGMDGALTLVGSMFRAARLERFGEAFMQRAAPSVLVGELAELRQVFLGTVHQLRTAQVPLEQLCVLATLHTSPHEYRRSGSREEPYEVLLGAGVRSWKVGQRIRYFRARGGEPRLLREGDGITSVEADAEYYVQRLIAVYCQQFAQAFRRDDFLIIFRLPSGPGPYADDPATLAELAVIRTIAEPVHATR